MYDNPHRAGRLYQTVSDTYCVVMNAESIIERMSMIEKIAKMICITRILLFA
jgi:hypothetical protein